MKALHQVILQIHDAPHQGVLAVSGAGTQAVAWLLGVAGASRTILEVVVPYSRRSMIDWAGSEPEQFVSQETALIMAKAAYRRALELQEDGSPVVGLACTAAIASDRPKRGQHRAYVATWDDAGWTSYSLQLAKGHRDRAGEEELVSKLVVRALAAGVRDWPRRTSGERAGPHFRRSHPCQPRRASEPIGGPVIRGGRFRYGGR